jgi:2-C-methyl-D-erythritol 4-phosphate cytidylyltransferase
VIHDKDCGHPADAVIVAAGGSRRMNDGSSMNTGNLPDSYKNKQLIEINGIPVIAITLRTFENCPSIRSIVLVINENDIPFYNDNIINRFGFKKIIKLANGADTRQGSVFNGLKELRSHSGNRTVLIHDGARPFVSDNIIADCIDAAFEYGAACVAVPMKDTVKKSDALGFISETIDRDFLWSIQTPQAFKFDLILKAHEKAWREGFIGTDDAILAEKSGTKIKLVMGSYYNIKITTPEDIDFANAIASIQP